MFQYKAARGAVGQTYPLPKRAGDLAFCCQPHLKVHRRKKDGKEHRYFSIVESRRVSRGRVAHRTVVYLGAINDGQQAAWRKTLEVFDESRRDFTTLSLFPEDREITAPDVNALQVRLNEMQLERPRAFGGCWLACPLWRQLNLDGFWQSRLPEGREAAPWEKVLRLLVVNRLLDRGSEFRVHRQWFDQTADGRTARYGFRGSGEGPTLSLPRSAAGAQTGVIPTSAAALAGPVPCAVRCIAFPPHTVDVW